MKKAGRLITLCLVMMVTLLAVATPSPVTVSANPGLDDPQHIHLTYQHTPTSAITVSWQTVTSSSGDTVLYDTLSRGGDPLQYSLSASGTHHTYAGASGYIHDVELTNLAPNAIYYFVCGGPDNCSSERSFRTAPVTITEFRFVIGGDSRGTLTSEPAARSQISQAMNKFNPSFVLHVGDMVYDGNNQTMWDPWFADIDCNWIGANGLTLPVIPSLGNHENNSTKYYEQFALLGNEQWYYYDWGPTLRIIVLDSEAYPSQISGDQRTWLESVLSSTPDYTWKIVMFHRNVYFSGGHGNATDIQQYWVPLFDKYHVNLVLQGHTHHYHRTKPMNNGTVAYSYRIGTMYLTAGRWGAPLNDYIQQTYSAYGNEAYHFVLASVFKNGSMHLEAKGIDGTTFDEAWLHSPLKYWDFQNGIFVRVQDANITQPPLLTNDNLTVTIDAPTGISSTLNIYCANRGIPLTVLGLPSWSYDNTSRMLTAKDIECNGTETVMISWVNLTETGPETPTLPIAVIHGFVAFLAAGLLISMVGVILERRKLSPRYPDSR